jgi:hypothetical protein
MEWCGEGRNGGVKLTGRLGRRDSMICPECGKPISGASTECMGCLRRFHNSCLVRVKKRRGRVSYRMCRECLKENPLDRVLPDESELPK